MNNKTPKSMRLHIGIFGRTNVGKSSILNMITGQDISIISEIPGTTTDAVEKTMELLPVGPVVFIDTAGIDDKSELGNLRTNRTSKIFDKTDVAIVILEPDKWTDWEQKIFKICQSKKIEIIPLINKTDLITSSENFILKIKALGLNPLFCSAVKMEKRNETINEIKKRLLQISEKKKSPSSIMGDLLKKNGLAVLIVPIDKEAPKGRLILPQVQTIRDLLDNGALSLVTREKEYLRSLKKLNTLPDIVVCDSQVVDFMVKNTPAKVPCTTFSILFSRFKGDINTFAHGAGAINSLKPGDKIAILEACTHHPIEDDIGRVKLPKWLNKKVGGNLKIDFFAGRDLPSTIKDYKVLIHCGACMLTKTEVLNRMEEARNENIPITNYGMAISECQGVLNRVLSPFPEALIYYQNGKKTF